MSDHRKMSSTLQMGLFAIVVTCAGAAAHGMGQAGSTTRPAKSADVRSTGNAVCTPGTPIGGIVVEGGQNPKGPTGKAAVGTCPEPTAKSISEKGVGSTKSR